MLFPLVNPLAQFLFSLLTGRAQRASFCPSVELLVPSRCLRMERTFFQLATHVGGVDLQSKALLPPMFLRMQTKASFLGHVKIFRAIT